MRFPGREKSKGLPTWRDPPQQPQAVLASVSYAWNLHRLRLPLSSECNAEKARQTTFDGRPKQSKRDAAHSIMGASIDHITNFVYAEKHKCQITLINQNHADRR